VWLGWTDGRARQAQGGGGGSGAWLTRRAGISKAGQTNGRADGQADGPNRAKIARIAILARDFLFSKLNAIAYTGFPQPLVTPPTPVDRMMRLIVQMTYRHSEKGGTLNVDGRSPYREYHIGPCSNLTSVEFGGIGPLSDITLLRVRAGVTLYCRCSSCFGHDDAVSLKPRPLQQRCQNVAS